MILICAPASDGADARRLMSPLRPEAKSQAASPEDNQESESRIPESGTSRGGRPERIPARLEDRLIELISPLLEPLG